MGTAYAKLERMKDIPAPAGTSTVRVQHATEDGYTLVYGTTKPTDASSGYAPGCEFIHTDGAAGATRYVNEGTKTSCDFNALVSADYKPVRASATGYGYGMILNGTTFFTGTAASKSYLLSLSGDREAAYAATGDSNDALLKISGNNYAANDTNFIFRGLNAAINNRSGGTLGTLEHSLGTQGKSGGTVGTIKGLTITAENYGTVSDLFGGLDILLKNEAAVATTEFGIRVRNENNSIAGPVDTVILVSETGANTGFTNFLKVPTAADLGITAATVEAAHVLGFDGDGTAIKIPISVGGVTYYLLAGTATALVADA